MPIDAVQLADRLARIETRLSTLVEELQTFKNQEKRLSKAERDIAKIMERLSLIVIAQTGIQLALMGAIAWLSSR